MAYPPEAGRHPSDFRVGDRVEFVRDCHPGLAPDDPFYQPPVDAGCVGRVMDVGPDHLRVRLDDRERWPEPVLVWQDGRFPDAIRNTLSSLKKLPKEPSP